MHYDIYERHKKVASYININDTVLDVGGELNHLSQFCSPKAIVVANLTSGDVLITKDKLPFKDKEFSVVCAIDVFEHVPQNKRHFFLEELLRVARDRVLLSFPVGTKRHIEYEFQIQKWLLQRKLNVDYLKEHLKFGLPTFNQIRDLTKSLKPQIHYSGNLEINKLLFRVHVFDPKIKVLRKIIHYLKLIIYFLTNPLLYAMLAQRKYSEDVVRAYIIIEKKNIQ